MPRLTWKSVIDRLESLTSEFGVRAWETAGLVQQALSKGYMVKQAGGEEQAKVKLEEYTGRCGYTLDNLLAMIECFPEKEHWQTKRLDLLLSETCKKIQEKSSGGKNGAVARKSMSWKARCIKAENSLKKERTENRKLRRENDRLKKEIKELQGVGV